MATANKQEVADASKQQAVRTVNNTFIDSLSAQLKKKEEFGLTFPPDYNPTNALTGAYLVLQETEDRNHRCVLDTCSQASIAHTLMDMVTMGLSMQKKQCYPVAYGGKLQCQVSYHGHKAMAHRYGAKSINAEVIYEGDKFKYHIQNGRKVLDEHTQDFQNIDLDKIVGAYCVIQLTDNTTYLEVMNMKQIKTAWKKGYGYKENSGTHKEFTDMMAKKTVTSRACKQIVQQYGDVFTVDTFENVESHEDDDKVVADSDYDIQQNANSVDFPEDDVIDAAEDDIKDVPVEETAPVEESAGEEIPEFMQE